MNKQTIQELTNVIIENLPDTEKIKFSVEEKETLNFAIEQLAIVKNQIKEEGETDAFKNKLKRINNIFKNFNLIEKKETFRKYVDAAINIAIAAGVIGLNIGAPGAGAIAVPIAKEIAELAKQYY